MRNKNKKILIVEDEKSLLRIMTDKFKRQGFRVFQARDGEQGLKSAEENCPDLILLDTLMPYMDGSTMVKELSKSAAKNTPVMFINNLNREEQRKLIEENNSKIVEILPKDQISLDYLLYRIKLNLKLI